MSIHRNLGPLADILGLKKKDEEVEARETAEAIRLQENIEKNLKEQGEKENK